jgi:hypothetical protein
VANIGINSLVIWSFSRIFIEETVKFASKELTPPTIHVE